MIKLEQNPELRKGHAGSFVGLMHKFILIWKAKQATPFSVIQGTVDYLLMYLALEIVQEIHAISPLEESWIVCLFFTSNPRLCKEQDCRLCIGLAVGFYIISEKAV